MKAPLQKQLVDQLALYRGQHARIAKACGIAQATISRVARGEVSPTLAVAQPLFDWLSAQAKAGDKTSIQGPVKRVRRNLTAAAALGDERKEQQAGERELKNLKPSGGAHGNAVAARARSKKADQ